MKIAAVKGIISPIICLFIIIPILYLTLGGFPERSFLKEIISVILIGAFMLSLAQFYLTRTNKGLLRSVKMKEIINYHKIIGYFIIPILFLHPFFVIFPRFFESGMAPMEAFKIMITTYSSKGVVFGIIAWIILFLLWITSLCRKYIPLKYTTWRIIHGILAMVFIIFGVLHAINLGRHTQSLLSIYIIVLVVPAILLLLKQYFVNTSRKGKNNE